MTITVPTHAAPASTTPEPLGADPAPLRPQQTDHRIAVLRDQIDAVDDAIIRLVAERVRMSKDIGALRTSVGGTRLSLSRENQIIAKFGSALGSPGTTLAMLLLKISRGRI